MDDLQYIAAQLLDCGVTSQPQPDMPASQPPSQWDITSIKETEEMNGVVGAPVVSGPKLSLGEYRMRKKELDLMLQGAKPPVASVAEDPSSSEEESDSDTDSSDQEESATHEAEIADVAVASDAEDSSPKEAPRTHNELDTLPPVEPPAVVKIPSNLPIIEVGKVASIIENFVIIESHAIDPLNSFALDIGSVLAFDDRDVLGEVFETFGPIRQPMYSIRFNNASEIDRNRVVKGLAIYQSPEFSKAVFPAMLRALKGSDASNIHDEEIPIEQQEFSDDEQEQLAKNKNKKRRAPQKFDDLAAAESNALDYDDVEDQNVSASRPQGIRQEFRPANGGYQPKPRPVQHHPRPNNFNAVPQAPFYSPPMYPQMYPQYAPPPQQTMYAPQYYPYPGQPYFNATPPQNYAPPPMMTQMMQNQPQSNAAIMQQIQQLQNLLNSQNK